MDGGRRGRTDPSVVRAARVRVGEFGSRQLFAGRLWRAAERCGGAQDGEQIVAVALQVGKVTTGEALGIRQDVVSEAERQSTGASPFLQNC